MADRRNGVYVLLISCLLLGLLTGKPFFFNLAYVLGGLLITARLWSWLALNRIAIGRQTRVRRTQVGRPFEERFSVHNNGWLPRLWIEVRDHSTLPNYHASRVTPLVLPRANYAWTARTTCRVRGEFRLGPLTLSSGDPFGFFQMTRQIAATTSILVYPATVPIAGFFAPSGIISGGDAQRRRAQFVTTNAAGVRDYAPGDSFNRIHWRSSARRDKLLVKEFELDPQADVWLFLDLSAASLAARPEASDPNGGSYNSGLYIPPSTEEYAVVIAASLAQHFLAGGRTLGFVTYHPRRTVMQPDRDNRQFMRILEALAVAKSTGDLAFEQTIELESHHLGRGATAILVSADLDPGWTRAAQMLIRRGVRVVAVQIDALSFGADPARGRADDQIARLIGNGAEAFIVRENDNLSAVLSRR